MYYSSELTFLRKTLEKLSVRTQTISELKGQDEQTAFYQNKLVALSPRTLYRLADRFGCNELYLQLPNEEILLIGPYLTQKLSRPELLEWAEEKGLAHHEVKMLETYYSGIPVLTDSSPVLCLADTFAESLWGENGYTTRDVAGDAYSTPAPAFPQEETEARNTLLGMEILEARYAAENALMDAVSHGATQKADIILSGFANRSIEARISDPIRNFKNYGIVVNTLLRKAAEQGGVHPLHLDSISSDFSKRIEMTAELNSAGQLLTEMFHTYCALVRSHAIGNYCPPVRRAILCIQTDLSADLSLKKLAKILQLSPGYLSSVFKKETGKTLTEYVCEKRMEHAAHLLKTTQVQVQTVAQHCGIFDVHYFSKLFKRHTGFPPREYREKHLQRISANRLTD